MPCAFRPKGPHPRSGATLLAGILLLAPGDAWSGDGRATINLLPFGRPGQQGPFFSFDITDPVSQGLFSVPTATLKTTEGGAQLTNLSVAMPALRLAGARFSPRYGDQRLELDVPARALSGFKLDPRPVRGLTLSAANDSRAVTLMVGRLPGGSTSFTAAAPRVLAFTSRVALGSKLAVTPRLVTPLGARDTTGSAPPNIGTGFAADVVPHVRMLADVAATRTGARRWAPLSVLGGIGQWSRGSVEASLARTGAGFDMLGAAPLAAGERALVHGRLVALRDVAVSGLFTTTRPERGTGARTAEFAAEVSRFALGVVTLAHTTMTEASQVTRRFVLGWQQSRLVQSLVRLIEERGSNGSRGRTAVDRRLQVELRANPAPRVGLEWHASASLAPRLSQGASRLSSRLTGSVRVLETVAVTAQLEHGLLGTTVPVFDLRSLQLGGDIVVSPRTTLQVGYSYTPGSRLPLHRRFSARVIRTVAF